jgi:hypothetical protein
MRDLSGVVRDIHADTLSPGSLDELRLIDGKHSSKHVFSAMT